MKICILTAGKGSRMGKLTKEINKALLPIGNKAIISQIIDKFSKNDEFVIALGYKGQQVKDYLLAAHPDYKFNFVMVKNYEGQGSGPGHSLSCCNSQLQEPFFFIPCDFVFKDNIKNDFSKNWVGIHSRNSNESRSYCNIAVKNNQVSDIKDKEFCGDDYFAFTGLLFVKDFTEFWKNLEGDSLVDGEHQISNGLNGLVKGSGLYAKDVDWIDVGDYEKYCKKRNMETSSSILKNNEFIYFSNNRVIKFFSDKKIVSGRVKKAMLNNVIFPKVSSCGKQFYFYPYFPGKTFYSCGTPDLFSCLLQWLDRNVWNIVNVKKDHMKELCSSFYYKKTVSRIKLFQNTFPNYKSPSFVNGESVLSIKKLLGCVPWEKLYEGIPAFIHGDLQFQNILYDDKMDDFLLIDWRQDFAGEIEFGDLYYDIAKLYGGILMNYDHITKNLFNFNENKNGAIVEIKEWGPAERYKQILDEFVSSKNLDRKKIQILVGLIYINMAALHHAPFSFALMALGILIISQELKEGKSFFE